MIAQHTPGPWVIGTETRGDEICTIHGVPRQPTDDGIGQGWVYIHYTHVVDGDWHWAGEDEKIANARLIAAAPFLFSALDASAADVAEMVNWSDEQIRGWAYATATNARLAIEKARNG